MSVQGNHRKEFLRSLKWVIIWMGLAILCNVGVYIFMGQELALQFLGCYLIELSLSVDNLFVFISIFMSFGIKNKAQHRVLTYGIIGAVVLRFLFIMLGVQIVTRFEWVLYAFGVILIISGIRMFMDDGGHKDPRDSRVLKVMCKFIPMTTEFSGEKFMVKRGGKWMATPLLAVVFVIECSDILFAIDSVPAAFSISTHPFIIYVANIFAILGLRQLYFVLEHLQERFRYVKYGVATILAFTGVKLGILLFDWHISIPVSIGFILVVLILSIVISAVVTKKHQ